MKITCIYAGITGFDHKLGYVLDIFKSILEELNVEIETFNIAELNISYYKGEKSILVQNIFNNIKESKGVIFAANANRLALSGLMQTFLEHFDYEVYGEVLKDKLCIPIITSSDESEYMAANYINCLISNLEAIPFNGMFVGKEYLEDIEKSAPITQMIERYAEDFYRGIKQKRKFFVLNPFKNRDKTEEPKLEERVNNKEETTDSSLDTGYIQGNLNTQSKKVKNLNNMQIAQLYKKEAENTNLHTNSALNNNNNPKDKDSYINTGNLNSYNFNIKNEEGIEDINKISELFSKKYEEERLKENEFNKTLKENKTKEVFMPKLDTLKQKTQSLHHYFQPHMAKGINIIIQVLISGKESFNGYFIIKDGDCLYREGVSQESEISIISDSGVWEEVLSGKSTLQKAFMLGRLKVKGNFVMISKFEQFFKID